MIVGAARSRRGRTSWRLEPEPEDKAPPCPELWVEGLVRPLATAAEALWLALAISAFARNRIVLPSPAPRELCRRLEAVLGVAIEAEAAAEPRRGEFSATLVRDPLDAMLSAMLRQPGHFAISCTGDPLAAGAAAADIRLASNAGVLRRRARPLDRIGELMTALLLGPGLSLCEMTAFLCGDEFAALGAAAVTELADAAGIKLVLPLAGVKTRQFGDFLAALNLPAIVGIRAAWQRYRMNLEVMAAIYRRLEPDLARDGGLDDTIARSCSYYMIQSSPAMEPNVQFDLSLFQAAAQR